MSVHGMSRELADLVKAVGDCKSKQEEDKIITKVSSRSFSSPSYSHSCFSRNSSLQKKHNLSTSPATFTLGMAGNPQTLKPSPKPCRRSRSYGFASARRTPVAG
jgi:hypothetical protein